MNQYDETLDFTFVGDNVENRGLEEVLDSSHTPPEARRMTSSL
jgi:hypothetical protein